MGALLPLAAIALADDWTLTEGTSDIGHMSDMWEDTDDRTAAHHDGAAAAIACNNA